MTDVTLAEFIVFPALIVLTVGGFWYARAQAKSAPGLMLGAWKSR